MKVHCDMVFDSLDPGKDNAARTGECSFVVTAVLLVKSYRYHTGDSSILMKNELSADKEHFTRAARPVEALSFLSGNNVRCQVPACLPSCVWCVVRQGF